MLAIALKFPAGRYHATPWGRHVNEGVPEWPPSPWRLLRSLVAAWKKGVPEIPEADVRAVLESLAAPPRFHLPPARSAHTRHAMPQNLLSPVQKPTKAERKTKYQGDPTIVFDTFVVVERHQPVYLVWPQVTLTDLARGTLIRLLACLGYLGRAESWCEATLAERIPDVAGDYSECAPVNGQGGSGELVQVLCADTATAFTNSDTPKVTTKGTRKKPATERSIYSPDWNLCLETEFLHKQRWPRVPGSVWVPYLRQPNCFAAQPATPKPATTDSTKTKYTVARFALDGPVLPLVTETLPLAEAFRYQALGRFKGVMRRLHNLPQEADPKTEPRLRSRTLSGKDDEGHKLTGGHDHAFYLPSDEDGDGRIDHLTVYAAGRFTTEEVRALDSLRDLTLDENQLRLLLVGLGTQESFVSPVFGPSREWVSATPFLAPRHFKERGQKRDKGRIDGIDGRPTFIAGLLVEAWEVFCKGRTDLPAWDQVEVTPLERVAAREREFRALEFARTRPRKRGDDGYRRGFGLFRLRFPVAVRGPIVLGYHAHFGLGQWVAVPEAATPCTPPAGTGAGGRG